VWCAVSDAVNENDGLSGSAIEMVGWPLEQASENVIQLAIKKMTTNINHARRSKLTSQ